MRLRVMEHGTTDTQRRDHAHKVTRPFCILAWLPRLHECAADLTFAHSTDARGHRAPLAYQRAPLGSQQRPGWPDARQKSKSDLWTRGSARWRVKRVRSVLSRCTGSRGCACCALACARRVRRSTCLCGHLNARYLFRILATDDSFVRELLRLGGVVLDLLDWNPPVVLVR